ncbi:MAG: TRAP transporter small permease [Limibacillus sp.]
MVALLDRVNDWLGKLSAWLFFLTGAMITYDVAGRYFFNAPTIWASELSLLAMIWGTFLGMATLLRHRQHIRITMLTNLMGARGKALADSLSLLVIAIFSGVATWYGFGIMLDSLERGRTAGTLLNLPNWWTEAVIPLGFGMLMLQCLGELAKLATGRGPQSGVEQGTGESL